METHLLRVNISDEKGREIKMVWNQTIWNHQHKEHIDESIIVAIDESIIVAIGLSEVQ